MPYVRVPRPRVRVRIPPTLVIVAVALLVMAPELASGLTVTDNFRFNLIWPEQFVELFRAGNAYPRWLPRCWGGMGSPVFYFYPPLFFWVTSLVDAATSRALGIAELVPLATCLVLIASGLSMRAWLGTVCSKERAELGAILYMLAPFHLYHLYGSGALAEASTYASVPLVMRALRGLSEGRGEFVSMLALAYGALLFSHLPTALLVTVFLIAPYVAFLALRSEAAIAFVTTALSSGLIGIGLAAVFVVPALMLLPEVSPSALSSPFYRPENWFFWHLHAGVMAGRMLLFVPASLAALLFAVAGAGRAGSGAARGTLLFWAALTILLVMLVGGFIPFIWQLPGFALVQFPWRALSLVEFTTVTLLVAAWPPLRTPLMLAALATLAFAYLVLGLIALHMIARTWTDGHRAAAAIRSDYVSAAEYLPAGTRIEQGDGPDGVRVSLPRGVPLASASTPQAHVDAVEKEDGGMTIHVVSAVPTKVVVRRFYFPHWRIRDGAGHWHPVIVDEHSRLVSFRAPAGSSDFQLVLASAPYELLARTLSAAALLLLIAITISRKVKWSRLRHRLARRRTPPSTIMAREQI